MVGRELRQIFGQMFLSCRSIAGKAKPESGAAPRAALDRDRASVLFENAMADGESESGTAVSGAESRFKNTRQVGRRDARPGVANHNLHALVLGARRGAVNSADREPAAARHEAKRIEREI